MTRESLDAKARRYLAAGAVSLRALNAHELLAVVSGGDEYVVRVRRGERWSCTCPAVGACAHQLAVQLCSATPRALRDAAERARQSPPPVLEGVGGHRRPQGVRDRRGSPSQAEPSSSSCADAARRQAALPTGRVQVAVAASGRLNPASSS